MQRDLTEQDWHHIEAAVVLDPSGVSFASRSTRAKRAEVDVLVADGCPLVTYSYGAGELRWHDDEDARVRWSQERQHLTSGDPKPSRDHTVWTAGRYEDHDGNVLAVVTGHC